MKITTAALLLSLIGSPGWSQDGQAVPGIRISDATLIDQNGARVHLSELLRNRIAVINTVFTTCPTICPVMGAHFAALTKLLGSRAGEDVILISISVDPTADTPARLKTWSRKFHPGPGWTLLTGDPRDVETVLRGLRLFSIGAENHSPATLIGDNRNGAEWRRSTGLQSAELLAKLIPPVRSGTRASR